MADDKDSAAAVADGVEANTDEDLGYKIPEQKGWSCILLLRYLIRYYLLSRGFSLMSEASIINVITLGSA